MSELQNIDLAITGAHILTIDESMTEFLPGSIYITGNRITWLGPDSDQPENCVVREKIDASGKIIMPVFFNGHNHAAMSFLRGLGNDLSLDKWLNDFIGYVIGKHFFKPNLVKPFHGYQIAKPNVRSFMRNKVGAR